MRTKRKAGKQKTEIDRSKLNRVERDLIEGLEEFVGDLKSSTEVPAKYSRRNLVLNLKPKEFSADQVRATRKLLDASQGLFAQFLGVSPKTIAAWEQGDKRPLDVACRFMDEIQRNPKYWVKRLRESVQVRSG